LLLGGTLNIRRGRNDTGTCIEVAIPLREREPVVERRVELPPAITEVISSALHPPAGDQTPTSPPYSTRPHTPPSLSDQAQ
jgi:hypothetical protein